MKPLMKKISLYIILLFYLSLSSSCAVQDDKVLNIEMLFKVDGYNVPFRASQIVTRSRYIALDDTVQIGAITDVRYSRNNYSVSERNRLCVFDSTGHYSFSIDACGRAENEYISLDAFDVNHRNGEISILDLIGSRILVFSGDGIFLRSFNLDTMIDLPRRICSLDDGHYIFYNPLRLADLDSLRVGAWLVDSVGRFEKELFSPDEDYRYGGYVPYQRVFNRLGDGTISLMGGEDHDYIYHITQGGECSVAYKLRCDLTIPKEYLTKQNLSKSERNDPNCYAKFALFETDSLVIVMAFNSQKTIWIYYDKRSGTEYIVDSNDDVVEENGFSALCGNCAHDRLINVYYPGTDESIDAQLGASSGSNPYLVISFMK